MILLSPFGSALLGGAMIGLSAVLLMALNGRIAGISGMTARVVRVPTLSGEWIEPAMFIGGLVLAPWLYAWSTGRVPSPPATASLPIMVVAGLLVGVGAVVGSGCTSGHGVCGLARLSPRSLVAVGVFMITAFVVVSLRRLLGVLA